MNDIDRQRVKHAANTEVVRRMLVKYFIEHGYKDTFDRAINPLTLQDMPFAVFGLDTKVEVVPHAVEIDPTTSQATIGWNLFVLGNQRMYIGETMHENLLELARQIRGGSFNTMTSAQRCTTPRRIVRFITRILADENAGFVDLTPRARPAAMVPRVATVAATTSSLSSQFLTKAF